MILSKLLGLLGTGLDKLLNMKHVYYFVPQCPLCRSWRTGRYVREPMYDSEYMYRKSLEHGEIIRFAPREPLKNCFCMDCENEWSDHVETKFMTNDEILEQKKLRGTIRMFAKYKDENYINGKPAKSSAVNRWFL